MRKIEIVRIRDENLVAGIVVSQPVISAFDQVGVIGYRSEQIGMRPVATSKESIRIRPDERLD